MRQTYDLTTVEIPDNSYLIIEDKENRHKFKVERVEGKLGEARVVFVRRIKTNDPSIGLHSELTLSPGQPLMGMIIPEQDFNDSDELFEEAGSINNLVIAELERLLLGLSHMGHKAPYKVCVEHLQTLGVLPNDDYNAAKKRLSALVRANPHMFKTGRAGGYIHLKRRNAGDLPEKGNLLLEAGGQVKEVSRFHVNQMIYHALMSGLFGQIKLVDDEGEKVSA